MSSGDFARRGQRQLHVPKPKPKRLKASVSLLEVMREGAPMIPLLINYWERWRRLRIAGTL